MRRLIRKIARWLDRMSPLIFTVWGLIAMIGAVSFARVDIARHNTFGIFADTVLGVAGFCLLIVAQLIVVRRRRGYILWAITMRLAYPHRRMLARLLPTGPYGQCGRCNLPWYAARPHDTEYMDGRSCFTLCRRCWSDLATPEARLPYYQYLV